MKYCILLLLIVVVKSEEWRQVNDLCSIPFGRKSCSPHYVIVGSMKCGTTSLYTYLLDHPQIEPLIPGSKINNKPVIANKEARFFLDPLYSKLTSQTNLTDALSQYFDIFPFIEPLEGSKEYISEHQIITGEASPMYVTQDIANRVKQAYPFGKIIWLMRNPIDRAYSEFWFANMIRQDGDINPEEIASYFMDCATAELNTLKYCNIDEFVENESIDNAQIHKFNECYSNITTLLGHISGMCEHPDYISLCPRNTVRRYCQGMSFKNSIYYLQILPWIEYFDSNSLIILTSEEFYTNTAETMDTLTRFLGIRSINWNSITKNTFNINHISTSNGFEIKQTESSSYPPLNLNDRKKLNDFFTPYNVKLSEILGNSKYLWNDD